MEQSVPRPVHDKSTFPFSATQSDRVVTHKVTVCAQGQGQYFRPNRAKSSTLYSPQHTPKLSTVDSLDVLRVTVLLCVQSDSHRRLWNREGQCAKLSTDRGVAGF